MLRCGVGRSNLRSVEMLDTSKGMWSQVASLNEARCSLTCAVVNGKVFAVSILVKFLCMVKVLCVVEFLCVTRVCVTCMRNGTLLVGEGVDVRVTCTNKNTLLETAMNARFTTVTFFVHGCVFVCTCTSKAACARTYMSTAMRAPI